MTDKDVEKVIEWMEFPKGDIFLHPYSTEHELLVEALTRMKRVVDERWMKDHNNEQVRFGEIILGKDNEISELKAGKNDYAKMFNNMKTAHDRVVQKLIEAESENERLRIGWSDEVMEFAEQIKIRNDELSKVKKNYKCHHCGKGLGELMSCPACVIAQIEKTRAEGRREVLEEVESHFRDAKRIGAKVWMIPDIDFQKLKQKKEII